MTLVRKKNIIPTSAHLVRLFITAYKQQLTGLNNTIQHSSIETAKGDNDQHIFSVVSHH